MTKWDEKTKAAIRRFARTSLRDYGDMDYIAARASILVQLGYPHQWSGLQALEKYMKAILLFNGESVKRSNHHDIASLERRIRSIPGFRWGIPDGAVEFIEELSRSGIDRYFQEPTLRFGIEIDRLDHAIWHVRRYCDDLTVSGRLDYIHHKDVLSKPHEFRIRGGYLEKVLDAKDKDWDLMAQREVLVTSNRMFGTQDEYESGDRRTKMRYDAPQHFVNPEDFALIEPYVYFPDHVIKHFEDNLK